MARSTQDPPPATAERPDEEATTELAKTRPRPAPAAGSRSTSVHTATILGRLRRTRGVSLYVAVVMAGLVLMAVTVRQAVVVVQSPDTGLTLDKSGLVLAADARWPGVERHDRIVAIDGQEVVEPFEAAPRLLRRSPGPMAVTFSRDRRRWQLEARTSPRSAVEQGVVAVRVLIGITLLVGGALAFLARPGRRTSWLAFIASQAFGAFVLGEIAFHDAWPVLGGRHQAVMVMLSSSLCIHLFAEFPHPVPFVERGRARAAWFYLPSVVVAAPFLATFPDIRRVAIWEAATIGMRVWLAGATVIAAGLLLHQYRRARRNADPQALPQCRALMVGLGLGLVPPAAWNATRLAFDLGVEPFYAHLNVVPVVIFMGMVVYALVRHNALAVDRFTAAVLGYAITTGLLAAAFAALLVALPLLAGVGPLLESRLAVVVVTIVVVLTFTPVYRATKRSIDRWFFREPVDLGVAMQLLRDLQRSGHSTDVERAQHTALEAALALRATSAQLWVPSPDGRALAPLELLGEPRETVPPEMARHDPLPQALAESSGARGVEGLAHRTLPNPAQEQLWSLGLAAAAPLNAHGVFAGFVGVGRKRSGLAYGTDELAFLSALTDELSRAMEVRGHEGERLGRYRIEKRLGTGGMAEVFLAAQLGPGGFERRVALKRPLPHLAGEADCLAMLFDEARIAAQLQHRHIVVIYEMDQRDGAYFIAMEYVDGPSVRRLLRALRGRRQTMPAPAATAIIDAVLDALDHAHCQTDAESTPLGVVHRDVTPGNILVSKRGEVKLTDFGIARAAVRLQATRDGMAKGTIPYMSPEQASREPLDHRSDLFSAGVVLAEMLTGDRLMPLGPTGPHAPLDEQLAGRISAPLQAFLVQALQFRPAERFQSADEMRRALQAAMAPASLATERELADWTSSLLTPR